MFTWKMKRMLSTKCLFLFAKGTGIYLSDLSAATGSVPETEKLH